MAGKSVSWLGAPPYGPKDSRRIRLLFYLSDGLFGGCLLALLVSLVFNFSRAAGYGVSTGIVVLVVLLLGWRIGVLVIAARWMKPQSSVLIEWWKVRRWSFVVLVSVLVGCILLYFEWRGWQRYLDPRPALYVAFVLGVVTHVLARRLSGEKG